MDLSGIIFVVLALAWALYLIPKAVKQHDDVGRNRSVDRFSSAMRVLARSEPVDDRGGRVVVTPPRAGERVVVPSRPAPGGSEPDVGAARAPQRSLAARRVAARAAARRRRRVTSVLVLLDVVTVALSAFAVAPRWAVAVPAVLTVLFLVLCRRQVRRENEVLWAPEGRSGAQSKSPRRAVRVDAAYGSEQVQQGSRAHHTGLPDDRPARVPMNDGEGVPVVMETTDGDSLWDPLPVTLPTYVNKARASRTVRTIDLGAPGTWSSGRDEADTALVDGSMSSASGEERAVHEHRRAVGS